MGKLVLYQPLSVVIHFEATAGAVGTEEGWLADEGLFRATWSEYRSDRIGEELDIDPRLDPQFHRRALIIDAVTLTPDQDSGSLQSWYFLKILQSLGYKLTFVPEDNFLFCDKYTFDLQRIGVECVYGPYYSSVEGYLKATGYRYDLVVLSRVKGGGRHIDAVRRYCPAARVIFDTIDLHFLRELRAAELNGSTEALRAANRTKEEELAVVRKSHCTMVVSDFERQLLLEEVPGANVVLVPFVRPAPGRRTGFAERRDICFIGGYQHQPNVDAVTYFVQHIWPLITATLTDVRFLIVGSRPPKQVLELASENVLVTGYVEDLGDILDTVRLAVAPLRYGAGIKGKIAASLGYGVPCVCTSLAVEGMVGLTHGEHVLIADGESDFAAQVIRLYQEADLWDKLSEQGLDFARRAYGFEGVRLRVQHVLKSIGLHEDGNKDGHIH
jgi:glycosyltransferase involved in cell wall biosynthesis